MLLQIENLTAIVSLQGKRYVVSSRYLKKDFKLLIYQALSERILIKNRIKGESRWKPWRKGFVTEVSYGVTKDGKETFDFVLVHLPFVL